MEEEVMLLSSEDLSKLVDVQDEVSDEYPVSSSLENGNEVENNLLDTEMIQNCVSSNFTINIPKKSFKKTYSYPYIPSKTRFKESLRVKEHENHSFKSSTNMSEFEVHAKFNMLEDLLETYVNGIGHIKYLELSEFEVNTIAKPTECVSLFLNDSYHRLNFRGVVMGKKMTESCNSGLAKELVLVKTEFVGFGCDIFIKTSAGHYYKLKKPSRKYKVFFKDSLLYTPLVVAFCDYLKERPECVFGDLRVKFRNWLQAKFQYREDYQGWTKLLAGIDSLQTLLPQARFLIHQHIKRFPDLKNHGLLSELCFRTNRMSQIGNVEQELTLVTPNVYRAFRHVFANQMEVTESTSNDYAAKYPEPTYSAEPLLELNDRSELRLEGGKLYSCPEGKLLLKVGDCVELDLDQGAIDASGENDWVARITKIYRCKVSNKVRFNIVWLYKMPDTLLYDIPDYNPHELFYSHHCECGKNDYSLRTLRRKVNVSFTQKNYPEDGNKYFCRFFYDQNEFRFTRFEPELAYDQNLKAYRCHCNNNSSEKVKLTSLLQQSLGKCFLLKVDDLPKYLKLDLTTSKFNTNLLVIGQLLSFKKNAVYEDTFAFQFRLFFKFKEVSHPPLIETFDELVGKKAELGDHESLFNELVLSSVTIDLPASAVISDCHVEYFERPITDINKLPPYLKHRGSGNMYFFTYLTTSHPESGLYKVKSSEVVLYKKVFPKRKGSAKPLKVLDLFSGSGSLGLGLSDAGHCRSEWAVDFEENATKALQMNTQHHVHTYTESVNTTLHNLCTQHHNYPSLDEVDMIAAGTPCQGYSLLNRNRFSFESLLKSSLVASLAAFVDLVRPKYVIMEQIAAFLRYSLSKDENKRPFSTLIAFFLRIGYQVSVKVLSAGNHGTCQKRNRVFIWAARMDQTLPSYPTAAHDVTVENTLTVPTAVYEAKVDLHQNPYYTPLPYLSVEDLIGDLPPILNGGIKDNKVTFHWTNMNRSALTLINCLPHLANSNVHDLINVLHANNQLDLVPNRLLSGELTGMKLANIFSRIDPKGQVGTIITSMSPFSTFPSIHYHENRMLTVREVARFQGFLDTDKFEGSINAQYKLIGNAVPRPVGFALGTQLNLPPPNYQIRSTQDAIFTTAPHAHPSSPTKYPMQVFQGKTSQQVKVDLTNPEFLPQLYTHNSDHQLHAQLSDSLMVITTTYQLKQLLKLKVEFDLALVHKEVHYAFNSLIRTSWIESNE